MTYIACLHLPHHPVHRTSVRYSCFFSIFWGAGN
nr:MAG TPA: hypothetical protein [Caudoviricetes sp.]